MLRNDVHPADHELMLIAEDELSPRRAEQVRAHLAACQSCRARMAEIEQEMAEFVQTHLQSLRLPPIMPSRLRLRGRLSELSRPKPGLWLRLWQFPNAIRAAAYLAMAILVIALAGSVFFRNFTSPKASSTPQNVTTNAVRFERGVVPDRDLTPGATRKVSSGDICSMTHEEVIRAVPVSLRQEVFRRYGIVNARDDDYEIDYLIAPGLGGREDIRNLWPETYRTSVWNAHVKDALEERLHQMVCAGQLDLATAQHDIATDWIGAYKKYFHTDMPLPGDRAELILRPRPVDRY